MIALFSQDFQNCIYKKQIFLDADVLGILFKNPEFTSQITVFGKESLFFVDQLTVFEFCRDVFLPLPQKLLNKFLDENVYTRISYNQTHLKQIHENALVLSHIFSMQSKSKHISLSDLYLAGRIMMNPDQFVVLTGNKKDFPSCVFDVAGTIFVEEKDENVRTFCVLHFNTEKFITALEKLNSLV